MGSTRPMTIEFTTVFTDSPVVEFEYPVDNLQPLFNDYRSWSPNLDLNGLGYDKLTKRLTKSSDVIPGSEWQTLVQSMKDTKLSLVNHMLNVDTKNRWPKIPLQISKQMVVYLFLVADLPEYRMEPHIDNRSVYAAGYLNVFDNDPVTVISTQQRSLFGIKKPTEYYASGKKGTGTIWLNTDNSWHWVNKVNRDRRVVMISFQIVPWN